LQRRQKFRLDRQRAPEGHQTSLILSHALQGNAFERPDLIIAGLRFESFLAHPHGGGEFASTDQIAGLFEALGGGQPKAEAEKNHN
jgi:hypothetical protein